MSRRDPFPMSSPEAQKLAGSVVENAEEGESKTDWHSMGLDSGSAGKAVASSTSEKEASESLVAGKRASISKGDDDIYKGTEVENDPQDDDFLDRPLWESRASSWKRTGVKVMRVLEDIYHRLYGDDLPVSEMLRTLCLASTLFFMIGGYWLLRSLKDPVLTALCGVTAIPKAKMLSVFVVLGVVSLYNRLLDSDIPRYKLFYVFGTFYFCLFTSIALLLQHPTVGLANQQPSSWRILGWLSYCSIESFGSVMVSLFWSFCNSNFDLQTAEASYGVLVATAQIGSILGPTLVNRYAETWGPAKCYLVGALCMLELQGTMYLYIRIYGAAERNTSSKTTTTSATTKKKSAAGVLEGLKLFWKYRYIQGIFYISCLFMVLVTIVDFTMKLLARDYFAEEHPCEYGQTCWSADGDHGMSEAATAAFTTFMGFFGQATNTLSFLLSLLGTSAVIRTLGLRTSLLLFPTLCLCVICLVRIRPTLYVVFLAMMTLKACSYALNNPTKEMLYQPTSSAVRYKAKSWIDIFGARGSKALGSVVTNAFSDSASHLVANGSLVGMAVSIFLIWNAKVMGGMFDEYTASGYIVGDENDDEIVHKNLELASGQQEVEDTSCAIPDDDDQLGPEEEGQSDESQNEDDEEDEEDDDEDEKAQVTMV